MPIDEAIRRLQAIRKQYPADDVQLWTTDEDGDECRVVDFDVQIGEHVIQVDVV